MSLSSKIATTVSKVIKKYGFSATFTKTVEGSFDPVEGKDATATTSTYTANCIKDKFKKDEVDGTNVLFSDVKLIIDTATAVPAIGDTVVITSVTYRLMDVTPIDPLGTTIVYELQLRS